MSHTQSPVVVPQTHVSQPKLCAAARTREPPLAQSKQGIARVRRANCQHALRVRVPRRPELLRCLHLPAHSSDRRSLFPLSAIEPPHPPTRNHHAHPPDPTDAESASLPASPPTPPPTTPPPLLAATAQA